MKATWILLLFVTVLLSCNKEKRYSIRLVKGETWQVESVSVDGQPLAYTGQWLVTADDIYKEVPKITWTLGNTNSSIAEWQFQDKGDRFQFNYVQLCEEAEGSALEELDYQAYQLSGAYEVGKHKRKEMVFTSNETKGFPNKKVEIKIKKS